VSAEDRYDAHENSRPASLQRTHSHGSLPGTYSTTHVQSRAERTVRKCRPLELAGREFSMSVVDDLSADNFFPSPLLSGGKPSSFSALKRHQVFPEVTIKETGEKNPDDIARRTVDAWNFADGGLFSIHIRGGKLSGSGVQLGYHGRLPGDLKIKHLSICGVDENFISTGAKGDRALGESPASLRK